MSIEREEFLAGIGGVTQDDGWAVIQRCCVITKCMHLAVDRRMDRSSGFGEQIDAQMDRAPFAPIVAFACKQRARIHSAWFVIASDGHFGTGILELTKDTACCRYD